MDYVNAQLERIRQQLGGLTVSQKMLTASLIAIMVMTVIWWARYAGQAEMVPLLDQPLDDARLSQITMRLGGRGIAYRVAGDKRIYVPFDRQPEILADLGYNELLPSNLSDAFDSMVRQMSPFDTAERTGHFFNRAKELELGQLIARFPGVKSATVKIDPRRERRVGESVTPSATIAIWLDQYAAPANASQLVRAAAGVVAGAHSDLKKSKISVVIDGRPYRVPDDDQGYAASDLLERDSQVEKYYRTKIEEALRSIDGVIVSVEVEVSHESVQREETKYDPAGVVQKPVEEETRTSESTRDADAAEPAALANAGMTSIEPDAGGASDSKTEDFSRTKFATHFSTTHETTSTPAGKGKIIAAVVTVPRSYLVRIYKHNQPTSQDPDDTALAGTTADVLARVRRAVQGSTGLPERDVIADVYPDFPMAMAATAAQTPPSTIAVSVGAYGKEIGIGALALVSLLMVSAIVRKGSAAPAGAQRGEGRADHLAEEEIAGVVPDSDGMLDDMELDEDAIRAQQIRQQVQTMVKDNPDAAANLVNRWLSRT